jgi:hypothetical protein
LICSLLDNGRVTSSAGRRELGNEVAPERSISHSSLQMAGGPLRSLEAPLPQTPLPKVSAADLGLTRNTPLKIRLLISSQSSFGAHDAPENVKLCKHV